MNEPLDELYLTWLYEHVAPVKLKTPSRTYWNLLRLLFKTEFVWWVPNDDNRVEDGRDLRDEFLADQGIDVEDEDWLDLGCSMLEMLIGLSRRLAFEAEGEPRIWFWEMIDNLGLYGYNDAAPFNKDTVQEIVDQVIWRTYRRDGFGGLFPLQRATRDQREVEIWYQLNAYLLERD